MSFVANFVQNASFNQCLITRMRAYPADGAGQMAAMSMFSKKGIRNMQQTGKYSPQNQPKH